MNYASLPFAKNLLASLFIGLMGLSVAYAADEKKPEPVDAAKGATLFASGDAGRNITACVACHGAAGNSTIAQNPKLAAQPAAYIHKQLTDFKGPTRPNPVMTAMAQPLNDADMQNIAAYLFAQTAAPGAAKDKDTVVLGKTIYRGGIAAKHVPACASCHGATGNGIPAQFPRLAGQHQDYTLAQLTNFRNGTRKNSAQMTDIAQRLSDDEMKAVADYVAGLK